MRIRHLLQTRRGRQWSSELSAQRGTRIKTKQNKKLHCPRPNVVKISSHFFPSVGYAYIIFSLYLEKE